MRYAAILILFLSLVGCSKQEELSCREIIQCQSTICKRIADAPYSQLWEIEKCMTDCARRGSLIGQQQFWPIDRCTDKLRYNPDADISDCERMICDE